MDSLLNIPAHYEALYQVLSGAVDIIVAPTSGYDGQTGRESLALPYIIYRQEVERAPYGTRLGGSSKILRSNWLLSVYARDLDESLYYANKALAAVIDEKIVTSDGYTTTAIELTGFMSLFEREGPNYVTHARLLWERSR